VQAKVEKKRLAEEAKALKKKRREEQRAQQVIYNAQVCLSPVSPRFFSFSFSFFPIFPCTHHTGDHPQEELAKFSGYRSERKVAIILTIRLYFDDLLASMFKYGDFRGEKILEI